MPEENMNGTQTTTTTAPAQQAPAGNESGSTTQTTQTTSSGDDSFGAVRGGLFGDGADDPVTPSATKTVSGFTVPKEYEDKPWVKELLKNQDPHTELFKQHEHVQKMLGSRGVTVPGEGAPPEQVREFRKALGIPEKAEDYVINNTAWSDAEKPLGEIIDKGRNPKIMQAVKESALRNNIPKAALDNLVQDFERAQAVHQGEELARIRQEEAQLGMDFAQLGQQLFKDKYPQVMATASQQLAKYVPPQVQPLLHSLDNKALMVVAAVANGIYQRHRTEDSFAESGLKSTMGDPSTMRERAMELMARPEYKDKNSSVYKQVVDMFKEMDRLGVRR